MWLSCIHATRTVRTEVKKKKKKNRKHIPFAGRPVISSQFSSTQTHLLVTVYGPPKEVRRLDDFRELFQELCENTESAASNILHQMFSVHSVLLCFRRQMKICFPQRVLFVCGMSTNRRHLKSKFSFLSYLQCGKEPVCSAFVILGCYFAEYWCVNLSRGAAVLVQWKQHLLLQAWCVAVRYFCDVYSAVLLHVGNLFLSAAKPGQKCSERLL